MCANVAQDLLVEKADSCVCYILMWRRWGGLEEKQRLSASWFDTSLRSMDDIVSEAASAVISNLFCSGAVLSGEFHIVENVLNLSSARPRACSKQLVLAF